MPRKKERARLNPFLGLDQSVRQCVRAPAYVRRTQLGAQIRARAPERLRHERIRESVLPPSLRPTQNHVSAEGSHVRRCAYVRMQVWQRAQKKETHFCAIEVEERGVVGRTYTRMSVSDSVQLVQLLFFFLFEHEE